MSASVPFFDRIDPGRATTRTLGDRLADCIDEIAPHPAVTLNVLAALLIERLETFPPEQRVNLTRAILESVRERIREGLA
jgi:hypothetical protein